MNKAAVIGKLRASATHGKSTTELYNEISAAVMSEVRVAEKPRRTANYLSLEFLIGRVFYNNLAELGLLNEVKEILAEKGVDIARFEEIEDAALGNGGLGRLAACYMDSGAAVGLPLYGYGLRYKYGLFRQKFEDGCQVETPDDWQRFGDPWSVRKEEHSQVVRFADMEVTAVPYDMPIFGKRVNVLRLYQAEGDERAQKISAVLYPEDNDEEGKLLRIRQEYFLSAAAVGDILREYELRHGDDYGKFAKETVMQLNDTHPVLAIPELIRLLMSKGKTFAYALGVAKKVFAYTNHTILPEALECWRAELLRKILPEIADILDKIDLHARRARKKEGYTDEEIEQSAIYNKNYGIYSMANTAVYASCKINGVAEIHSEIIKEKLFPAESAHHPERFTNVTNGVAQRRWLYLSDPELCDLIDKCIGENWRKDFGEISKLKEKLSERWVKDGFTVIKSKKKKQLYAYLAAHENVTVDGERIVYAQIKRLHEYKRQLMTAFALLRLYYDLKEGKLPDFAPSVFVFGAKSAPGYFRAKGIIKYINEIISLINGDSETRGKLMAVFVTEYNVSYAEKIVAATDVSLQISTAGLEASGTGNMKFMMNGAVTCGTMDGANIEIVAHAGRENNYIFGATVEEIEELRKGNYDPKGYLAANPQWKKVVETLIDGTFSDGGRGYFAELYGSLTEGAHWHKPDHYFIMRDLDEYFSCLLAVNRDFRECHDDFVRKQLYNTASSAFFSSDRSVRDYATRIWKFYSVDKK